jgi:hypothetical protein
MVGAQYAKLAAMANIHTMDQHLSPLRYFLIINIVKLQYNEINNNNNNKAANT